MTDPLLEELLAMPVGPKLETRKVSADDFTRRVEILADRATVEVRGTSEETSEPMAVAHLQSKGEDPSLWEVTGYRSSEWTMPNGQKGESARYTFARRKFREMPKQDISELLATIDSTPQPIGTELQNVLGSETLIIAIGDMQFGKGLKSDTPILTTEGWVKHGDLRVGMQVYGRDGLPKRVMDVLPTTVRDLYEVEFGDGSIITCDDQHQWSGYRKMHSADKRGWEKRRMTVSLSELVAITAQRAASARPFVADSADSIAMPEVELPVDPYTFGLWLGDGHSASGIISLGSEDRHLIDSLGSEIPSNSRDGAMFSVRIHGLTTALRSLGVLGMKHVPEEYLLASIPQRLALVQGLMDTDGHATDAGACEFVNTNRQIVDSFVLLLRSLGMRPRTTEHIGRLNGEAKLPYWRVTFRAKLPVFRLARKLSKIRESRARQDMRRSVVAVRHVGQGEAQCITVEGGLYLAGEELVVTHNCDGDGAEGTLSRAIRCLDRARNRFLDYIDYDRDISHVHIAWLGDHIEGFSSQGGANVWRTKLTLNEQIRLTRRVMLHAMMIFAPHVSRLTMAAVPGNHGEAVRFMGKGITRYDDSHDTESLIAVADAAKLNPDLFSHVEFYVPETDELTVVVDCSGTVVAHAHGHQWNPNKHFDWWKGQAFNKASAMHTADLLLAGHLHHEHIEADGPRLFVGVPAMESESTWWRHRTGTVGSPGLMLLLTSDGVTSIKETIHA